MTPSSNGTLSKAIILAGGDSTSLDGLNDGLTKALLPVLNRPLIEWQIRALSRSGIEEIGIALSPESLDPVSRSLEGNLPGSVRLHFATDPEPRGPAGGIKLLESMVGRDEFLVVDGGTFLGDVRIDRLVEVHRARRASVTIGLLSPGETVRCSEAVVTPDGSVEGIFQLHGTDDRRRSQPLAGISVFDAAVLELVPQEGFFDVKERLLAELRNQGAVVAAASTRGVCVPIDSVERYYWLQTELLESDFLTGSHYRQLADGVWIGEGTEVAPSAYLLGPLVIGSGCCIGEGAQLVGPTVIGDGSRIGSRSVVRSSVLWERVRLLDGSKVESSVLTSDTTITGQAWLRHSVLAGRRNGNGGGGPRILSEWRSPGTTTVTVSSGGMSSTAQTIKAIFDYFAAAVLLIVSSPVLGLCALAIRLDSRGPVFFRQSRCGKDGKPFSMFKLRTMVSDADEKQHQLRARNETDGPVFKIETDPRITRVGAILRRTSLDELPQLINVLKGEMSLVGPRPLAADEMRYCPAWRDRRLSVKPGMTGLWQVSGRSNSRFHDWIRYDIDYVKRQSLALDLQILAKTVLAVARRSGAY